MAPKLLSVDALLAIGIVAVIETIVGAIGLEISEFLENTLNLTVDKPPLLLGALFNLMIFGLGYSGLGQSDDQ